VCKNFSHWKRFIGISGKMLHKHALQNIIKKVNTHVENGDNYLKSLILSRYLRSFTQIHNQNHSKKNPTEPFLQQQYGKFS